MIRLPVLEGVIVVDQFGLPGAHYRQHRIRRACNMVECPKWPDYHRHAREGRRGEIGS